MKRMLRLVGAVAAAAWIGAGAFEIPMAAQEQMVTFYLCLLVAPASPAKATADPAQQREISFDLASKEGRLMREIDDALRRIYNGVYGICEASGQPIPRARLEALPWARYTVKEQENIERQQRAGRLTKEEE